MLLFLCLTSAAPPPAAVIIAGGDGVGNTTPPALPAPFPYWDAIGKIIAAHDSPPDDEHLWDRGGTAPIISMVRTWRFQW